MDKYYFRSRDWARDRENETHSSYSLIRLLEEFNMPKYYCDYCKSYLTHDTMSVRKSHLQGKNHIRYYCNYYETKVRELGEWTDDLEYTIDSKYLSKGAPGLDDSDEKVEHTVLPPPPFSNSGLPAPPPAFINNMVPYQRAIMEYQKEHAAENQI